MSLTVENKEIEEWRDIPGTYYRMSNNKRVKSERTLRSRNKYNDGLMTRLKSYKQEAAYQFFDKGTITIRLEGELFKETFPDLVDPEFMERSEMTVYLTDNDVSMVLNHKKDIVELMISTKLNQGQKSKIMGYIMMLERWIKDNSKEL